MKEEKKVSVIIPVYNVEKYLCQCMNSVLEQKYENLEIILVDDGSIDASLSICNEYSKKDLRVRVFHQKNKGVSSARNLAMQYMTGEYVVFIDSDDYINNEYIKYLIDSINKYVECEMVSCGFAKVDENGKKVECKENLAIDKIFDAENYMKYLFEPKEIGYQGYLWNKIFFVKLIKTNKLTFNEQIFYNEDRLFLFKYLLYCNHVYISDKILYFYRQHYFSAMAQMNHNFSYKILTEIDAFREMKKLLQDKRDILIYLIISEFYSAINLRKLMPYSEKVEWINKIIYRNFLDIIFNNSVSLIMKLSCIKNYLKLILLKK
ncbi:glycosyltransferase family 2 protein [Clostridium beijerinckii]|uniref:glycosyltransferase family 2 protein n=1 Tax=Clostridium beijerinckii TaxID=1520 RepID=UPI0003D35C37|nr:glycosyltransferase family 2 protein [Clostridium beijerinckii]AQS18261.1 glycosyltransferase family 2 protein [Clostridium beijerinckii NRRL B-598]